MVRVFAGAVLALLFSGEAARAQGIQVITDPTAFVAVAGGTATVSFNLLPVGFLPFSSTTLGDVLITLGQAGPAFPIFGPGPLGFTTNFLSTVAKDGVGDVTFTLLSTPQAVGFQIASPSTFPVTLTVTSASGEVVSHVFSSAMVTFLGFTSTSGLTSVRISSPVGTLNAPIVNVGNITYSARANAATQVIPTLSTWGMLLMMSMLILTARARWRARSPTRRASSTGRPNRP